MDKEYVKKLVIERLKTIPPNVSFSIGGYGDYTRDELINQVLKETDVGKETVKSELQLLRETPRMVSRLRESNEKTSSD